MVKEEPTRRRLLKGAGFGALAMSVLPGAAFGYGLSGVRPYDVAALYGDKGPPFRNVSWTFGQSGTYSRFVDLEGGWLFKVKGPATGTSPTITSYSVSVMQSTDGGATWNALKTGSAPYNFAVPVGTPALYRVDCTMSPASVSSGGIACSAECAGVYDRMATALGIANLLPDGALTGDLTLYKVCAGNTFAKLTVPAAARRIKGPLFTAAMSQDIRAEYADVVSVFDGNGNAITQAASQTDPSTVYKAGTRVTAGDPTGGMWSGDFACTAFPLGIYGYATLSEAVRGIYVYIPVPANSAFPVPNYAALGV